MDVESSQSGLQSGLGAGVHTGGESGLNPVYNADFRVVFCSVKYCNMDAVNGGQIPE